jgi:hypothetical protein
MEEVGVQTGSCRGSLWKVAKGALAEEETIQGLSPGARVAREWCSRSSCSQGRMPGSLHHVRCRYQGAGAYSLAW